MAATAAIADEPKGFGWRDFCALVVRARIQLGGSIVLVWDNVRLHLTAGTRSSTTASSHLIAARSRYGEVKAPVHLVHGEKDWSRPSDREANKRLLLAADVTQGQKVGHFIAVERPHVLGDLLNAVA
ncbi:hypothetical protein PUR53_15025 [Streptomyces sp. SP18BB07]|nr:hypothetical protein [Streptomyces sp. SP18BB07]